MPNHEYDNLLEYVHIFAANILIWDVNTKAVGLMLLLRMNNRNDYRIGGQIESADLV